MTVRLRKKRRKVGSFYLLVDNRRVLGPLPILGRAAKYRSEDTEERRRVNREIEALNPKHDPLRKYGDTPTGVYRARVIPPKIEKNFGLSPRIDLFKAIAGQALIAEKNGRDQLQVHAQGSPDRGLIPTHGCLRTFDKDQRKLINALKMHLKPGQEFTVEISEHVLPRPKEIIATWGATAANVDPSKTPRETSPGPIWPPPPRPPSVLVGGSDVAPLTRPPRPPLTGARYAREALILEGYRPSVGGGARRGGTREPQKGTGRIPKRAQREPRDFFERQQDVQGDDSIRLQIPTEGGRIIFYESGRVVIESTERVESPEADPPEDPVETGENSKTQEEE